MSRNPEYPVIVSKNQWIKVATGVTNVTLHKMKTTKGYLYTYRLTDSPAPTNPGEGLNLFLRKNSQEIFSSSRIDVYVYSLDIDGVLFLDFDNKQGITSIIGGSDVTSNITVELIKKGFVYTVQTVIKDLAVNGSIDILLDPKLFDGYKAVVYELAYNTSLGKVEADFYLGGTYTHGTDLLIYNRNENSANLPKTRISKNPVVSVLGTPGPAFLVGSEVQGNNLGGGGNIGDPAFPLEINPNIDRILRFTQSGGTGTYDLEFRLVFAEIF